MTLLLDTHVWLWWNTGSTKLPRRMRTVIANEENRVFFSVASAWEIATKYRLGRIALPSAPSTYLPARLIKQGFDVLPIELRHAAAIGDLPNHHQDPFDRMLVAQAILEDMAIVTVDPWILRYDVKVLGR